MPKPKATETHHLTSWDEFHQLIRDIRQRYGAFTGDLSDGIPYIKENQLLFRGEPDAGSDSALKTTLERASAKRFDVRQYAQVVDLCVNELESFTGKRWNIKSYLELVEEINGRQDSRRVHLGNYEYLVYLRHHGFPSPLLDWTASPFIAAYFAFRNRVEADRAAIYVYIEDARASEPVRGSTRVPAAMIWVLGPHVTTHPRHFAQKAWYSVATEWFPERKARSFCSHADVFCAPERTRGVLIKVTLPISQRGLILHDLNDYNINDFTLFQSEDSLVKAVEMKYFDMNATS